MPETEEELKTWFDDTLKSAAIEYGVNLKNNQVLTKQILDALDHERDYNLNFDKFSQMSLLSSEYELVSVGDLCELGRGRVISKETIDKNKGIYPVYSSQTSNDGIFGYLDTFDFDGEYVTWTTDGANAGTVFYRTGKFNCTNVCGTLKAKSNKVLMKYLAVVLNEIAPAFVVKLGNPKLMNNVMEKIQIPLPPIEVQQKVINEVSGYENIIKGCDLIINNYKPTIEVDEDWEKIELGELAENLDSKRVPITEKDRVKGDIPYYGASGIVDYVKHYLFDEELLLVSEDGANLLTRTQPIAFSVNGKCWVNNHAHILRFKNRTSQKWVEIYINNTDISNYVTGAAQPKLNQANLNGLIIPFPSLETQEKIINELEFEFETMSDHSSF
ncbi:MAG: restriction endonuclease subunit S [Chitinophagaceae bacterium]